ncbi:hypothetical protein [Nostoc sp.]|uniref:hypothetical protein n=1 Tax=Nostoc sp. TaxID=1180 RepID=UPI002FFCC37F
MDRKPQEVNPSWLTPEVLIEFIDELRDAGYKIGVSQYIIVQDLILALIAQGDNLDRPQRFKSLLSPLLCHSPTEQEDFYQRFDQWLQRMGFIVSQAGSRDTKAEELQQELHKIKKQWRRWQQWSLVVILTIIIWLILSLVSFEFKPSTKPLDPNIQPSTKPSTKPLDPNIQPSTKPLDLNIQPSTKPLNLNIQPSNSFLNWQFILGVLLLIAFLTFLAWGIWWFWQAHQFLVRHATNQQPQLEQVSISGLDEQLFPKVLFLRIAQDLRRRIRVPSAELDINRTLEKSVQRGGWFTPVYSYRQVFPEYLVLIDRANYGDHQARFVEEMIDRLKLNEVFITGYYFDGDPRVCFPMTEKGPPCTLNEIATKYSEYRLIIFSDAQGLFSSRTGELERWSELFSSWSDRAVLTPKPSENWGYQELELSQQFIVQPATPEGLMNLIRSIQSGKSPYEPSENIRAPFPEELRVRSRRWIQRDPPESLVIDEVLKSLRRYLGKAGYDWLSACAVFPELHWNLTLYLGNTLQSEDSRTLLQACHLNDLARLPWFRQGYMPDWLRKRLISEIPRPQEKNIRSAIEALLITAVQGHVSGMQLEIARKNASVLSRLAQPLLRLLAKRASEDSLLRDYIFLDFMAGSEQKRLAVRLPEALYDLLHLQGLRWGLWLRWVLGTTLSSAFAWGVSLFVVALLFPQFSTIGRIVLFMALALSGFLKAGIQLYMLQQYVPKISRSMLVSWVLTGFADAFAFAFAAFAFAFAVGAFAGAAFAFAADAFAFAADAFDFGFADAFANANAFAGAVAGAIIGVIQSHILRRILHQRVSWYGWWTLSHILGDSVGWLAFFMVSWVSGLVKGNLHTAVANSIAGAIMGTVLGLASGASTGFALLSLLRQPITTDKKLEPKANIHREP